MKGDIIVLEKHHKDAARKIVPEIIEKIKEEGYKIYHHRCWRIR